MTGKATVAAPSNIAFVKYWGIEEPARVLPFNPSISMTLSGCVSRCTVEHRPDGESHEVMLRSHGVLEPAPAAFAGGVIRHLERLKSWAGVGGSFRVATENNFPTGAGLASSASGFAALALATVAAVGREVDTAEASRLARLSGSGSAARSVLGGYVEWPSRDPELDAAAFQIAEPDHWELWDVVAVVDSSPKDVSSRDGHARAPTSRYWERRLEALPGRLDAVRRAIAERRIEDLGPVLEEEAIDLHLIAMSSRPPIFYWTAGTLAVLGLARRLRDRGIPVWATIDAGPNVHLITTPESVVDVLEALDACDEVESTIADQVGGGPVAQEEHLV